MGTLCLSIEIHLCFQPDMGAASLSIEIVSVSRLMGAACLAIQVCLFVPSDGPSLCVHLNEVRLCVPSQRSYLSVH